MGSTLIVATLVAISTVGQVISEENRTKQDEAFQQWWGTDFEWKFDELPTKGSVPEYRIPYSGYIYPDTAGGTVSALNKYDMAFNGRRYLATGHERWDTTAFQEPVSAPRRGLFGRVFSTSTRMATPHWHGHCNGWTSAAIRHAEPVNSVVRNGVTFTPADIKGLLAELYIYNEMNVLAGSETYLDAATFHAIITNWVGRGEHSIGMEADPGKEKWNYPIYAFASSNGRISDRQVEVKMNVAYAKDSRGEFQQSPRYSSQKYFHYYLNLDEDGKIVGGNFYRDSSRIDMLWIPLSPKESGQPGHERGNPYIKASEILSIWRDSVPEETRKKWLVIDQPKPDRVSEIPTELVALVPLQEFPDPVVEAQAPAPPAEDSEPAAPTTDTAAAVSDETEEAAPAPPSAESPQAAEDDATTVSEEAGEVAPTEA
ncbi:MAG: hypothetical protein H6822_35825 [Planctomycetaceae bacterium]|nr:hypothetical protein [Planctomycetales bacterium]MCB9927559.1 hypothetical protein [Planctomycetaceae bacterium]